jgi:hypothetical protein
MFTAPTQGNSDSIKVADLNGHLLIITPTEYKTGIQTVHGEADAVECHLVDLDTGLSHNSILFFNVALKSALKQKIGEKVLARIGQGIAKPGKSAPWILLDATGDADAVAKANAHIGNAGAAPVAATPATNPVITPDIAKLLQQLGAQTI